MSDWTSTAAAKWAPAACISSISRAITSVLAAIGRIHHAERLAAGHQRHRHDDAMADAVEQRATLLIVRVAVEDPGGGVAHDEAQVGHAERHPLAQPAYLLVLAAAVGERGLVVVLIDEVNFDGIAADDGDNLGGAAREQRLQVGRGRRTGRNTVERGQRDRPALLLAQRPGRIARGGDVPAEQPARGKVFGREPVGHQKQKLGWGALLVDAQQDATPGQRRARQTRTACRPGTRAAATGMSSTKAAPSFHVRSVSGPHRP